jgi:hypothetical protein
VLELEVIRSPGAMTYIVLHLLDVKHVLCARLKVLSLFQASIELLQLKPSLSSPSYMQRRMCTCSGTDLLLKSS